MRSDAEKRALAAVKKFAVSLHLERTSRLTADEMYPPGDYKALEKKYNDALEKIASRDRDAKEQRIVVANLNKKLAEAEKNLGRDETQKKIHFLTTRIAHLESSFARECENSRHLANEAHDAVLKRDAIIKELADSMVALDDANAQRDSYKYRADNAEQIYERRLAKDYAELLHRTRKDVEVELKLWRDRATQAGWHDPEAVTKEHAEFEAELRKDHPEWSDYRIQEVMAARRSTVGLEI